MLHYQGYMSNLRNENDPWKEKCKIIGYLNYETDITTGKGTGNVIFLRNNLFLFP